MSGDSDDAHVTRRELQLELKALVASMTWRQGAMLAGAVGLLKFDAPKEVTGGAIVGALIGLVIKVLVGTKSI